MYQVPIDPYCYPASDVLQNKSGLETAAALEAFETAMTFARRGYDMTLLAAGDEVYRLTNEARRLAREGLNRLEFPTGADVRAVFDKYQA